MDKDLIKKSVAGLIAAVEGDYFRAGVIETPDRVARAYEEMLGGYDVDIDKLFKHFEGEGKDQVVAVKDIDFTSFCEHHFLPFTGRAHVAYLPKDRVIGASKIPRLVHAYACRLQLQERIAEQVANTLMEKLQPLGVAVIIYGEHTCMRCRGVKSNSSQLINSVMLGRFREDPGLRSELLALLKL